MTFEGAAFLFGSAVAAGAINSIAGGGTLLSFPAAVAAGLPPIVANATNAVAMAPGSFAAAWTFRRELSRSGRLPALLVAPAVLGSLLGAALLRGTSERLFDAIVPWLVLGATLAIIFQRMLPRPAATAAAPNAAPPLPRGRALVLLLACQLAVGVYGGYFGAAMGIVTLAFLAWLVPLGIHETNAIKNVLAAVVNGIASVYFFATGLVDPLGAVIMAAGAISGGVLGARLARRISARSVRLLVIAIGLGITALLAYRHYVRGA